MCYISLSLSLSLSACVRERVNVLYVTYIYICTHSECTYIMYLYRETVDSIQDKIGRKIFETVLRFASN